jgi:hypothetical protein
MLRLKSIGVMSAAKISALLYGGISLLMIPVFLIMAVVMTVVPKAENQPPAFVFVIFAIVAPALYAAMGFVVGAGAAFLYNLIAGWIGGMEMQFEGSFSAPVAVASVPPQV